MWVVNLPADDDSPNKKIYAYDMAIKTRVPSRDLSDDEFDQPTGIWSDGATMWVADIGDARLYAFHKPQTAPQSPDRDALIALYNATDGDNWRDNTNWLSDHPVGEWYGVGTDGNGRVVQLFLESNRLSGQIPSDLGDLTNLQKLGLYDNQLSGQIPTELGNLSNLQNLIIATNRLSGQIPSDLGDLTNLQELVLYDNQLSGQIPTELGNLSNLQVLIIDTNRLSGQIPSELGNLSLRILGFSGNELEGCIPQGMSNIPENDFDKLGLPFCDEQPTSTPTPAPATLAQTSTPIPAPSTPTHVPTPTPAPATLAQTSTPIPAPSTITHIPTPTPTSVPDRDFLPSGLGGEQLNRSLQSLDPALISLIGIVVTVLATAIQLFKRR